MVLIEELIEQIPMAEKLLEIKGVGIRTVSGFFAKVGNISRFNNPTPLYNFTNILFPGRSNIGKYLPGPEKPCKHPAYTDIVIHRFFHRKA